MLESHASFFREIANVDPDTLPEMLNDLGGMVSFVPYRHPELHALLDPIERCCDAVELKCQHIELQQERDRNDLTITVAVDTKFLIDMQVAMMKALAETLSAVLPVRVSVVFLTYAGFVDGNMSATCVEIKTQKESFDDLAGGLQDAMIELRATETCADDEDDAVTE